MMAQMIEMRKTWGETMVELTKTHPNLMVLDGDLGNSTLAQIVAYNAPDFYMNMGIAEQNMMGVAAGMASVGLIPWLSSFACFLANRDLDQLRVTVAQPRLGVKMAGHYSGILTGKTGKTHIDVGGEPGEEPAREAALPEVAREPGRSRPILTLTDMP